MASKLFTLIATTLLLTGCYSELYHQLDERDANEMVIALEIEGIEAAKAPDPEEKGKWLVRVATGVRVDALEILQKHGLPKPKPQGFDAFYPSDGLIPTADEEHVLKQFALSQEIRKSILTIDGVIDAHVNLVLPKRSKIRLNSVPAEPARASVVVKYRTPKPPTTTAEIQSLVAASVSTMTPDDVVVLLKPSEWAQKERTEPVVVSVGPISVAAGSKSVMQTVFLGFFLIIVLLSGAIVFVLMRRRR